MIKPFQNSTQGHVQFFFVVTVLSAMTFMVSTLATTRILRHMAVVEVPDLSGKSVEMARSALRIQQLSMDIGEYRFDQHTAANQIITQDPLPGRSVKSGRIVRVIVSRGSQAISVPNLVGMGLREAGVLLGKKGLKPGKVSRWFSDAAKSAVMDQSPAADQSVSPNNPVNLLVSAGPRPLKWAMPDLKGMKADEAFRVLKQLGIELGGVQQQVDDKQGTGMVLDQRPAAGDLAGNSIQVILVVSRHSGEATTSRYLTLKYHVPAGAPEVRVKMVVLDDSGQHEVYNAMEKADTDLSVHAAVHGSKAALNIFINGRMLEERNL